MDNYEKITEIIKKDDIDLFELIVLDEFYMNEKSEKMDKLFIKISMYMKLFGIYCISVKSQSILDIKQEITLKYMSDLFKSIELCLEYNSIKIYEYLVKNIYFNFYMTYNAFDKCYPISQSTTFKRFKYSEKNINTVIKLIQYYVDNKCLCQIFPDAFYKHHTCYNHYENIIEVLLKYKKITKENKELFIKWLLLVCDKKNLQEILNEIRMFDDSTTYMRANKAYDILSKLNNI